MKLFSTPFSRRTLVEENAKASRSHLQALCREFEVFEMKSEEIVTEYFSRVKKSGQQNENLCRKNSLLYNIEVGLYCMSYSRTLKKKKKKHGFFIQGVQMICVVI